ncbi:MAG: 16S rRNA (guanine(527)-N(7))-methyltransferase RsmG [Nitrospiraceae bacterium]|nr:16S rRNA (guanine(527)-N(7))-methyltransferase RsmG [Nitrospiraceae bacterium]
MRRTEKAEDLLRQGLDAVGLPYASSQVDSFLTYLAELEKWNRVHNLTGFRTAREIVAKNFLDSLLFLKVLPPTVTSVADIGSGAGFPGIPIGIMRPDLRIILVEPAQKKSVFLRHICHMLQLRNIGVLDKRIEEISGVKVDAVVTRALFTVAEFISRAGHLLSENGVLILSKGLKVREELGELDGIPVEVHDLELPIEKVTRHLVVVKKK